MIINSYDLREKDVINICDGRRLGFICDFLIDSECGKICAVFVSESFFGIFDKKNTLKIDWCRISCIGTDTVLVDIGRDSCCRSDDKCGKEGNKKGGFLF